MQQPLDGSGAEKVIAAARYRAIFAALRPLAAPIAEIETARGEDGFSKRQEVVRISSPTTMNLRLGTGTLYDIDFSNEYVERGGRSRSRPSSGG